MKRYDDSTASAPVTAAQRYSKMGGAAMLLLFFFGCATPRPVTIQHEGTPSLSEVTQSKEQQHKESVEERTVAAPVSPLLRKERSGEAEAQRRKELADQKTVALLEILKSKKVISDEDAALITGLTATGTAGGQATAGQKTAALVELLKSKNLINDEEAALITGQTATGTAGEQGPASGPQQSVDELRDEIRGEVTNELLRQVWQINQALKEKDKRLRFGGDIRLRYEKDLFDKNNADFAQPSNPSQIMDSKTNQSRFKYRVRFGAEALVNDQVDAVIRLSTGSTSNPVSTNSTEGDYMNKDSVVFDLAYLKWKPWKSLTLYGGRMPNPFFSSDLVWDTDLNFEGFALQAKTPNTGSWTPFLTTGAFALQQDDVNFSQHGKWLLAGQVGAEKKNQKGISTKIGAAFYDFKNITGIANDPFDASQSNNWTAPLFMQKGNTLFNINPNATSQADLKMALASEYRELNVTGILDVGFWDPVHVVFLGDYVKNFGFDQDKVNALVGDIDTITPGFQASPKEVVGYQLGMAVGYPIVQDSGQWKVYFYKKYLEGDAVVDAFTDSDFHLGGTNAKGWILGTDIGLAKNYWMTVRWLAADEISGPPLAIDVLQVDINAKF